ncbi:hypothetical protein E2C01_026179 [Portunus trituberculatus]|uniref:Uncharacterized protein n=1 Tax=Portunus trituberculatus TaxID=210409 RepID=A0A5B7EHF2_PORTR|nr:hypothetical protein [Portunus trituberculatus]
MRKKSSSGREKKEQVASVLYDSIYRILLLLLLLLTPYANTHQEELDILTAEGGQDTQQRLQQKLAGDSRYGNEAANRDIAGEARRGTS